MSFPSSENPVVTKVDAPVVLLVDHEEEVLRSLSRALGRLQVKVNTATTVSEAGRKLNTDGASVVICELRIGDDDGLEFLAEARALCPESRRVLLTGDNDTVTAVGAFNKGVIHHFLTKPWDDDEVRTLVEDAVRGRLLEINNKGLEDELLRRNRELAELNSSLEKRVADRTEELRLHARLIEHAFSDLQKSYGHVLRLASSLAVLRDPRGMETANLRADMAASLAEAGGLGSQDVRSIRDAALLSELGTIGLPDDLLVRPFCDFTGEDTRLFSQSPLLAEAALMGIPGMRQAALYLRHQFERYDGSGYPDNLAGDNIPLGSRIITIVRDYTDFIRGRFSGFEMSPALARAEMLNLSSVRYDPALLSIFCERCGAFITDALAADELRMPVTDLRPGMVLANDLYSERGMILLTQGHELNGELIGKLRNLQTYTGRELDIRVVRDQAGLLETGA